MSDTQNRILEYHPEDMTVTAEAGVTLGELQTALACHRQWLPIDPAGGDARMIREIIDFNSSGPRRYGCGTIRDHLIGIAVKLADGRLIHSGGKVVKNVAGYDLMKLFIGCGGSLGTVSEATFKLRPLPDAEEFRCARIDSLQNADRMIAAVMESPLTPNVFDLHRLESSGGCTLVLGFAGSREEVEWQLARAAELGVREAASLTYEAEFYTDTKPVNRVSVLPSRLIETIGALGAAEFVARAGNGVIYHRGAPTAREDQLPFELMRRLKSTFDPNGQLSALPWLEK